VSRGARVALALGAAALGAVAFGAVAIGALAVGRARVRRLEIEEVEIGRLRVREMELPPSGPSGRARRVQGGAEGEGREGGGVRGRAPARARTRNAKGKPGAG
jgi:hypothetical protein